MLFLLLFFTNCWLMMAGPLFPNVATADRASPIIFQAPSPNAPGGRGGSEPMKPLPTDVLKSGVAIAKNTCPTGSWLCPKSNRCINDTWVCDGEWDCESGDDEMRCPEEHKCGVEEYRCQAPIFMPPGAPHGRGGENNNRTVLTDSYLLHLMSPGSLFVPTCISKHWRCDGEADCFNGDDEQNCEHGITCNNATQFACATFDWTSPLCIPREWLCDGQTDCLDGKDELPANCPPDHNKCDETNEFTCTDGQCIFKSWHCDGDADCHDGSDEVKCPNDTCTGPDRFKCATGHVCIPESWKCDGEQDCPDHSDETGCPTVRPAHNVTCKSNEFKCASLTQCISEHWRCDGDADCFDGSDERNCTATVPVPCPTPGDFRCRTGGACVSQVVRCDGFNDCSDGSDEENCTAISTPAPPGVDREHAPVCDKETQYACPGSPIRCINYADLCRREQNGAVAAANDCSTSVCNHNITQCEGEGCTCRRMGTTGRLCYCQSGYEPAGNNACQDVNECLGPGVCDQVCTNRPGSYFCSCYPGFHLTTGSPMRSNVNAPKSHKCRAIGPDPLLLLANRATIRQFDIVTNRYYQVIGRLESVVALDYWHANKTLVWSDVSKERIHVCNIGGGGDEEDGKGGKDLQMRRFLSCMDGGNRTLIKDKVVTPDGLAIDWVHGLLFWTDTGLDTINVMDLKTNHRTVLIDQGLDEPRAIAVDPAAGLIFWTDWGNQARIERAGMDGQHRLVIVKGNTVKWPNGLAVDIRDQRLYWADAKMRTISTCDYWGGGVRTIVHSHTHLKHPFAVDVFEERIYWTDWDQEAIVSANKFTGEDVKILMRGVTGPMAVRVYHQQAQPQLANKCTVHPCAHLCLPRALYRQATREAEHSAQARHTLGLRFRDVVACACATGYRLDTARDNATCILVETVEGKSGSKLLIIGTDYDRSHHHRSLSLQTWAFAFLLAGVVGLMLYAYRRSQIRGPRSGAGHFSVLQFENPVYHRTTMGEADIDNGGGTRGAGESGDDLDRDMAGTNGVRNGGGRNSSFNGGTISILPRRGGPPPPAYSSLAAGPKPKPGNNGTSVGVGSSSSNSYAPLGVDGLVVDTTNVAEYGYDQPPPSYTTLADEQLKMKTKNGGGHGASDGL